MAFSVSWPVSFSDLSTSSTIKNPAFSTREHGLWAIKIEPNSLTCELFPFCTTRILPSTCAVFSADDRASDERFLPNKLGAGCFTARQPPLEESGHASGDASVTRSQGRHILDQLDRARIRPDSATYVSVLQHCARSKDLSTGKLIHDHMRQMGLDRDPVLGNHLLQMYGNCGALGDAHNIFIDMHARNVVSWTILIRAYAQQRQVKEALELFQQMQQDDVIPDKVTFVAILSIYASQAALIEGKRIHAWVIKRGFDSDVVVGNCLATMYSKCGSLQDARRIFDKMSERSVVSWNALITAYARYGEGKEAIRLFRLMQKAQKSPNIVTWVSILDACATQVSLAEGKQMHAQIVSSGLESNILVGTSLVSMYGKCFSLENAQMAFNKMHKQDGVSWNAMIAAYSHGEKAREALELFRQMQVQGIMPDTITFVSVLDACASHLALNKGKQIHALIIYSMYESDLFVGNALINMYGKCGSLEDAQKILNYMPEQNIVSWNAMISAYSQHGKGRKALQLFQQMEEKNMMPDNVTFVSILDACASEKDVTEGKVIHNVIKARDLLSDMSVGTALVNMYGKCGSLKDALKVFDDMHERNVVSWNALITAYAQHGKGEKALSLFQRMLLEGVLPSRVTFVSILDACASQVALAEGKHMHARVLSIGLDSDVFLGNSLINMYGDCGNLADSQDIFDRMPNRDVVSWNALIAAYARHGQGKLVLQLFENMELENIMPDEFTLISILDACTSEVDLVEGRQLHCHILASGFESNLLLGTALVNMYGKCGSLEDSKKVFIKMFERDVAAWNAMIGAYSQQGQGKETLCLFKDMQLENVIPNSTTFTSILSACSHSGLVNEGCLVFESIHRDYGVTPVLEHYNIIVDLLGRVGQLDEAEDLINSMPLQATVASWMCLLGASKRHSDLERGWRAAENVMKLNPENAAPYVLLWNVYAASGSFDMSYDMAKLEDMADRIISPQLKQ